MKIVLTVLHDIEVFLRLMVGDTSMIKPPDLSPLDHVPTVNELLHGARRK